MAIPKYDADSFSVLEMYAFPIEKKIERLHGILTKLKNVNKSVDNLCQEVLENYYGKEIWFRGRKVLSSVDMNQALQKTVESTLKKDFSSIKRDIVLLNRPKLFSNLETTETIQDFSELYKSELTHAELLSTYMIYKSFNQNIMSDCIKYNLQTEAFLEKQEGIVGTISQILSGKEFSNANVVAELKRRGVEVILN